MLIDSQCTIYVAWPAIESIERCCIHGSALGQRVSEFKTLLLQHATLNYPVKTLVMFMLFHERFTTMLIMFKAKREPPVMKLIACATLDKPLYDHRSPVGHGCLINDQPLVTLKPCQTGPYDLNACHRSLPMCP